MINNKTTTALQLIKRLAAWLFAQTNTVVYAHPVKRDTHLNSSEAIHNWLETIDRSNSLKQGDTQAEGGGASVGNLE